MSLVPLALSLWLSAVTPSTATCEVSGATTSPADVTRAERACQVARERFGLLLGSPVPDVSVVLWQESGYRTGVQGNRAVIYWPTARALAAASEGDGEGPYGADPWQEVLPHEIAHVLLAARFFGSGPDVAEAQGGYGTPFPDWLDEAVAIWVEPAGSRAARLYEARELTDAQRHLGVIMGARHPATSNAAVLSMRDGALPPKSETKNLEAFYPQSIALLGFVFDRGGRAGMIELIKRLRAKPGIGPDALVGLPGITGDRAAVDAAWRRWLANESARSAAVR